MIQKKKFDNIYRYNTIDNCSEINTSLYFFNVLFCRHVSLYSRIPLLFFFFLDAFQKNHSLRNGEAPSHAFTEKLQFPFLPPSPLHSSHKGFTVRGAKVENEIIFCNRRTERKVEPRRRSGKRRRLDNRLKFAKLAFPPL